MEIVLVGRDCLHAFADGGDVADDVFGQLFFEVAVADGAAGVLLAEVGDGGGIGHRLHDGEDVAHGLREGRVGLGGAGVGHGLHHLFADRLVRIGQVEAVAFALAHLARAVEPGNFHQLRAEVVGLALGKEIDPVEGVETAGQHAGDFEVLLLILAHRNFVGAVQQDVGGHQHRVAQQPCVDVFGLFADFILERSGALQLADVGVHAQQQRQLGHLRHVALDVDRRHIGIEARSEVFRLVVPPAEPADPVQRHGHERIRVGESARIGEAGAVPCPHFERQPPLTVVFERMDQPLPAASLDIPDESRRPDDGDMSPQAAHHGVVPLLPEMGQGRSHPAQRADRPASFGKLAPADGTERRVEQPTHITEDRH